MARKHREDTYGVSVCVGNIVIHAELPARSTTDKWVSAETEVDFN